MIVVIPTIFIGLPWLIMHYITKWKSVSTLTADDERMLEEIYDLGRRLDERVATIERIMTVENPGWRQITAEQALPDLDSRSDTSDRRIIQ